ncbi:hypothetical protein MSH26_03600 [bacterium]|nr:hypothetical protein [bacterium]MDY3757106.1 hypothetical protein [Bacilli bacterium]
MKDNNQNNNNSQPIVLGELKKEKSSKPFLAIIIFALLLGTCFGLPYIKEYLNTENNSVTDFYRKYIRKYFEKDTTNIPNTPSDNQTTEPVINKYTCTIETTTTYNEKIEYTYIFTDNKLTSINEVKTSSKTTDETINTQIKTTYQNLSDQIKNLTNCTSTLNETDTSIELTNILDLNNADLSLVNNENYFNNQTDAETIKLNLTNKGYTCS